MNVEAALEMCRRISSKFSESPSLDSQLLVSNAVQQDKVWVLSHPEYELQEFERKELIEMLGRFQRGEPLPYILGEWEFFGRRFFLTRDVLIPRPETELLVEEALSLLTGKEDHPLVIDVGSGSGCIGISLLCEVPSIRLIAIDISLAALRVTVRNAERYQVLDRMDLIQSDLLSPIKVRSDLLCGNLPYLTSEDMAELEVARREPPTALDGGAHGLVVISRLIDQIPGHTKAGGGVLLEVREGQAQAVVDRAADRLESPSIQMKQDLAGVDRVVVIEVT